MIVYDVATQKRRTLPLEHGYTQIYWGLTWSPDGKWIRFKGTLPDGTSEIAAVATEEGKKDFKVIVPSTMKPEIDNADTTLAWGGPNNEILVCTRSKDDKQSRLYLYDVNGAQKPKAFPGIPADWNASGPAWSRDGKRLVFSAVLPSAACAGERIVRHGGCREKNRREEG